ncbi:hypothetical protein D3C71_157630 [compost metagenome]
MQITQFTARKQIGFKLPTEAFRALSLMEDRRSPLFQNITTLRLNLSRLDKVVGSHLGVSASSTVYVDFDTDHNEEVPAAGHALELVAVHARAALAIDRFLPGTLEHGYVSFPRYGVDGGLVEEFGRVPDGRIVHFDEHYVVVANARPGGASIHFLRDGKPAWTEAADFEDVAHVFWDALTDSPVRLDGPPALPTIDLDKVTEWVMRQAYVPALEHDGSFDISGHKLASMITYAKVAYADGEVIVTGSGSSMTAHFEDDGRYGCTIFQGDSAKRLYEAMQTPGLAVIDPSNPVRVIVDDAIAARRHYLATRDLPAADRGASKRA